MTPLTVYSLLTVGLARVCELTICVPGRRTFSRAGCIAASAAFFSSLSSLMSSASCGAGVFRCWCRGSKCCFGRCTTWTLSRWTSAVDLLSGNTGAVPSQKVPSLTSSHQSVESRRDNHPHRCTQSDNHAPRSSKFPSASLSS